MDVCGSFQILFSDLRDFLTSLGARGDAAVRIA
jgi:hypothetical protein